MKKICGLLLSALLAASATPASAEITGSRIGSSIPRTKPELVFDAMAKCFLNLHPERARKLLLTVPGSIEEDRQLNGLTGAFETCLNDPALVFEGSMLSVEPDRLRRSLATGLVPRSSLVASGTTPARDARQFWTAEKLNASGVYDGNAIGIVTFGQCVASTDWAAARALVLAKPDSKEAKAATKAIKPSLDSCLNKGLSIKIDRRLLVHVIGEGMYYHAIAAGEKV